MSGLDGVVVADTELSRVDGERGELVIRGYPVESLAGEVSFEQACGLLWRGSLDAAPELPAALGAARVAAFEALGRLGDALDTPDGMDALRAALAHLRAPRLAAEEQAAIVGALGVYAAAWARGRAGEAPIAPDPSLGHAADVLRMMTGRSDSALARGLDTYLVAVIDHGMNASTFTARVVTSTRADGVSAVVAALGALKGPLHGGAPGPVLDMLDAVGEPSAARAWLAGELAAGRRLMGFGHRVYRVRDPRAAVFEGALEALAAAGHGSERLALAQAVEREAIALLAERYPGRRLEANVEFGTALLLEAVGLDRAAFSPMFAVGRCGGWLAHVAEQRALDRLIRPRANYVGPLPAA